MRDIPNPQMIVDRHAHDQARAYADQYLTGYLKWLKSIGLNTRLHLACEYVTKQQPWIAERDADIIAIHLFSRSLPNE